MTPKRKRARKMRDERQKALGIIRLQHEIIRQGEINQALKAALEESVKLQSHYAKLLNQWDGGHRIGFDSADAWIARLKEMKKS